MADCVQFTIPITGIVSWIIVVGYNEVTVSSVRERESASPTVEQCEMEPAPLRRYTELFVVNPQIHARQTRDGRYYKVDEPVSYGLLRKHLAGELTLGFYATSSTGERVKWVCLDHDDQDRGLRELAGLARKLQDRDIHSLLEGSRRGAHLWVFFDNAPTVAVREYFLHLVEDERLDVEVFPKVEEGLSLVRGPLGVHRKVNRRYPFYEVDTVRPVSMDLEGNLDYLTQVERADVSILAEDLAWRLRAAENALAGQEKPAGKKALREHSSDRSEIAAIKEGIGDLRAFIGQFVELNHKGQGSCPLHPPDEHASFAVHDTFWVCFHETKPNGKYLGGDVIEFWQRYRGVDFPTALEELQGFVGNRSAG